jgi:hypothetical protein
MTSISYFEVLFATEPGADFDLLAPMKTLPRH